MYRGRQNIVKITPLTVTRQKTYQIRLSKIEDPLKKAKLPTTQMTSKEIS